jgi:hypothetical protein
MSTRGGIVVPSSARLVGAVAAVRLTSVRCHAGRVRPQRPQGQRTTPHTQARRLPDRSGNFEEHQQRNQQRQQRNNHHHLFVSYVSPRLQ